MSANDLLGRPMTDEEQRLLAAYRELGAIAALGSLPACARANVLEALAALWQAVNDLALTDERPEAC
jgi:hypothetical protein